MGGSWCKGLCDRFPPKTIGPRTKKGMQGNNMYSLGNKRCQLCEKFIYWEGRRCPCCSYRLRSLPRSKKFRDLFKQKIGRVEIRY